MKKCKIDQGHAALYLKKCKIDQGQAALYLLFSFCTTIKADFLYCRWDVAAYILLCPWHY